MNRPTDGHGITMSIRECWKSFRAFNTKRRDRFSSSSIPAARVV